MGRTALNQKEKSKKRRLLLIYIVISVVTVLGTVIPFALPDTSTNISDNGTIKFINLEGGFYGITADSGINYDPINLKKEFEQDGLRVKFRGRMRTELVNIHQWGTVIELTGIEKTP